MVMRHFSQLAGQLTLPLDNPHERRVTFRRTNSEDRLIYRLWTRCVAYGSMLLVVLLTAFLFKPSHWVALKPGNTNKITDWVMLGCLAILQIFLLLGTYMAARSSVRAKDPVPMTPPEGLRVAFITTRAPGEPFDMVEKTLRAAKRVEYDQGHVDVWLLDETKSPELKKLCTALEVRYFSRKNFKKWNVPTSTKGILKHSKKLEGDEHFAARTKHGNLNAWGMFVIAEKYDIVAGVDTDQVPEVNFLTRLLGYFHDADVAYVVGPQVYANQAKGLKGLVTRWAESQASFFQSTIQRAANSAECAMFVGTNYAVRSSVLAQIGGYFPCITEDLATGLIIHTNRNDLTGNNWKSVYTPDVLALGEGPNFWGPYFSQQWRWAAGAFDAIQQLFGKAMKDLPTKARAHYLLILLFYPIAALTWLFGVLSSMLYLLTGASAITVGWTQFISLYCMSVVLQLGAYFWNHRSDVSPFTPPGSYGVAGMIITSLTAPIYFSAFMGVLIGRKVSFVVTPKGNTKNPDWFKTFNLQFIWGLVLAIGLVIGWHHHRTNAAMLIWTTMLFVVCITPIGLGLIPAFTQRLRGWQKASGNQLTEALETTNV